MPFSVFQVVVLALFGALAVTGVIIFAFVVGGSKTLTIGDVEMWGTLDDTAIITVLRQLGDTDARYKQILYTQKNRETYGEELTNALAAGRGPDIFLMRQDEAVRDATKVIIIPYTSLPQDQFQNTFIEAANPFMSAEGIIGIPLLIDPLVLYWNRDVLAAAGFAEPPKYWNELYDIAAKITKRDDANTLQRTAVALGEYQNVTHAKDIISLLILQAGGKITTTNTGVLAPAFASRAGDTQQPTESALRFYAEFANPSNQYYTWNRAQRESRAAFSAGTLALYIGYASEEPLLRQTNPNLNFAVAPVPQIKSKELLVNVGTVYGVAIPRTTNNPEGALTAAYLLANTQSSKLLSQGWGIPSARRDVLAQGATGIDDLFNKQAIIAKAWIDPDPGKTDELFRVMIEGITSGAVKLSEAVQRAEETMGTLILKP